MNFLTSSKPPDRLLATAAPLFIWETAKKEAARAPMIKFKVGAVIYDPSSNDILSSGCSHPDVSYSKVAASVHAEQHALSRYNGEWSLQGASCAIYILNGHGGCSYLSRPCYSCAARLYKKGIERVVYAERVSENSWTVKSEHPEEMIARAPAISGLYARQQRIPSS